MIRVAILILLASSVALGQKPPAGRNSGTDDPVAVAHRFLPPNTELAQDYSYNFHAGRISQRWPAVLTGHILEPHSQDVVFAYYSPRQMHVFDKTLFVTLLHRDDGHFVKVSEVSYRDQVLLVSRAIRIVHLAGLPTDATAVITGVGADLGGHLEVFVWLAPDASSFPHVTDRLRREYHPWGWQNIFPPNGSMEYFYFFPQKTGLEIALSSARHPGLSVSPPPMWFQWNGRRFVKIPPPQGSSKWKLPD